MAKNVTVTPADGDIQFQNTSGTDAGKIAQDGDNLVITNAVGDILFGDTNADVYIGDGVNSVDVLFEVSGAIKADPDSQGVTLTLGGAETDLQLYAPSMSNLSSQGSESTTLMINANGEIGTRELGSAAFSNTSAFATSSHNHSIHALTARRSGVNIDTIGNDNFWEVTIGTQTDLGTKPTSYVHVVNFGDETAGLQLASPYSSSVKLYYRQGTDNSSSENGANTYKDWREIWTSASFANNSANWNTAYGWGNHASAGYLTSETYTGTVTSVTVGTGLDVANGTTTPNITLDLSELTDMTANVNTSQDELILLDNGAERRKLFSEIFGSAAYSNTSAFAAASHNHDSSYPAKSDSYISLFSNHWQATPEAKYVTIALPYMSGSGSSGYYIFDVFGYRDIGSMDSLVNYRVYAHVRSNGTEENDVKFHVYSLHEAASEEFEFAYKVNAGSTTSVYIYIEEDYSGLEIFGIPVTEGSLNLTTSGMISISETAPTGTTEIVRQVAHPKVDSVAGTYGNTANGTKIDTITIDENGHVTNVATGATGNMTGFFVEDGDGTEVQIVNAREWKFVEGTGIDINWTDTSHGNDSDPYDLTFAIKNNSIGIDQLNVTDGTNGQVLTTNGSGTLSFSTVTSGSSYGWTLAGTDIESGDEITLAGGLSFDSSTNTLSQTDNNTTYSNATTSADGLMSSTDKTKLDGIASGAEVNVQSDWNATSGDAFIQNKPNLFDGAYSSLSGVPSTFAPSSHNHDGRYYTESEMQHFMARALGWVSGYGNSAAGFVNYNFTQDAIEISGDGDDSTGGVFKAIRVKSGDKVRFTVMLKGSAASGSGLYLRLYQHNGDMPDGKTHVSNNASSSESVVQEDDSGLTSWEENRAVPSAWTNYEKTYTAPADGYVSLVVLNWSGHGNESIYVKQPDIQFEKVNDASKLGGTDASSYLTAHPAITEATTNLSNSGRTYIQSITLDSNGHVTGVSTGTETVTNTNTTYSAGSGLDLTGTTFSIESDLRDGVTRVGKDSNNFIAIAVDTGVIDFTVGGTWVARMESDGDLHIKGDVIAFSSIFNA